jgi:hypothetical protein
MPRERFQKDEFTIIENATTQTSFIQINSTSLVCLLHLLLNLGHIQPSSSQLLINTNNEWLRTIFPARNAQDIILK